MLDAVSAAYKNVSPKKQRDYSYLKPYQFKPGHAAVRREDGTAGRPEGTCDALTSILASAPVKARQYIKSTAPAVLVDARKWIMPIESDASPSSSATILVGWLEQRLIASPSLLMTLSVAVPALPQPDAPTLNPSAGTGHAA